MRIERDADSDGSGEVAVLHMEGGRANALNVQFLSQLNALLDDVEASGARALVITGYENFFSAGLDLASLEGADRAAVREGLQWLHRLCRRLFTLPLPVVAAINGHAIAGGCVLALQADERIMAQGRARIGLKEVQLGVGLPVVVVEALRAAVAPSSFVPLALEGQLVGPERAAELGLVQRVIGPDELLAAAVARARELAAPGLGYAHIKASLRAPHAARMDAEWASDLESWLDTWFHEDSVRLRGETVAALAR